MLFKKPYHGMNIVLGGFIAGLLAGHLALSTGVFAQGYPGVIAPEESGAKNNEPLGYPGLIPGRVPEKPKPVVPASPAEVPEQHSPVSEPEIAQEEPVVSDPQVDTQQAEVLMTPIPEGVVESLSTSLTPMDQLKEIAKSSGFGREAEKVPAELEAYARQALSADQRQRLNRPRPRDEQGMTPQEAMIQKDIDKTLSIAADKNMSEADRRERLSKAISDLSLSARVLHLKAGTPDAFYRMVGVPDTFMNEEKEASKRSLQRIQSAFEELRKYE